jgi:hypothetical protein
LDEVLLQLIADLVGIADAIGLDALELEIWPGAHEVESEVAVAEHLPEREFDEHPEIVARLRARIDAWEKDVDSEAEAVLGALAPAAPAR